MIINGTKNKSPELPTYKLIKAEFLRWVKDNPDKNFNEAVEAKILKKMHTQRMESAELYEKAGRNSLAENEKFEAISEYINDMVSNRKKYKYNYFGLWFAAFNLCLKFNNRYYCSEFVRDVLKKIEIEGSDKMEDIVQPIHFLDIPNTTEYYCGKLSKFADKNYVYTYK